MHANEIAGWCDLIMGTAEIYQTRLTVDSLRLWWTVLAPYSLETVTAAFMAHISNHWAMPTPADIVAQIRLEAPHAPH